MAVPQLTPTGVERFFNQDEIIVSKTDLKGIITYANRIFLEISGFTENEVLGEPHNCIRHPDMPRTVFRMLWDRIQSGQEVFAYIVNLCKNGDHYWVFAHVTPTFDPSGRIIGYHSNRRVPSPSGLGAAKPLYKRIVAAEKSAGNRRGAVEAGQELLESELGELGFNYDEWIWNIEGSFV